MGLLASVQSSGLFRFGRGRAGPDLVLAAVIAWAFLTNASAGALWGFMGGLMLDGVSASPFPLNALAITSAGLVVGASRLRLYSEERLWVVMAGLLGAAVFYAISLVGLWFFDWRLELWPLLRLAVLPAMILDVLCVQLMVTGFGLMRRRLAPRML